MQIEIKKSFELESDDWINYANSFNTVFSKNYTIDYFKHKYLNTIDGLSYHALLKVKNNVIGGFTVIPYKYFFNDKLIRVGLTVDVFIMDDHRSDLMALYKMYKNIKEELKKYDIALVITNPNDTAYLYWKKMIRFNDVGNLYFYALPFNIANVISHLPKISNLISNFGIRILLNLSALYNTYEKSLPIKIDRSKDVLEKQRYTEHHSKVIIKNSFFSYRIVNENDVRTCYLIDFYDTKKGGKNSYSLYRAIKYLYRNEKVDLIIFVGKLSFIQFLLFKVPYKYEPRHLHFMIDVIDKKTIPNPEFTYNFKNWDFGLFNYDVR